MRYVFLLFFLSISFIPTFVQAQEEPPRRSLIDGRIVQDIRNFVDTDIVRMSVQDQNQAHEKMSQSQILDLDKRWRAERKSEEQPLVSAVLGNPLSVYLTRIQAQSVGLYTNIIAMNMNGLNAGQSIASPGYWQGEKVAFQKTYPRGPRAVFVDNPKYDKELGIWSVQVNLSLSDADKQEAIGAITVGVNLTELQRRKDL